MAMNLSSEGHALVEKLGALGFERFRRALSALALSFFAIVYSFLAVNAPEGWGPAFAALGVCYAVAFFAVVAEWFWGRWFATGIGWSGLMVAIISLVMIGWVPALLVYGGIHALIVVPLAGKSMAARYDLQEDWRKRYRMDDLGVARLRKTITRSAASLPSLILWALGPKDPGQGMLLLVSLALLGLGLGGLVRARTWGWLAVAGAAGAAAVGGGVFGMRSFAGFAGPELAIAFLIAAVVPFTLPAIRFLRAHSA